MSKKLPINEMAKIPKRITKLKYDLLIWPEKKHNLTHIHVELNRKKRCQLVLEKNPKY